MRHVTPDQITALALGLLEGEAAADVREHCDRCPDCGDQLGAAMLLASAARARATSPRWSWGQLPLLATAASVFLIVGTLGMLLLIRQQQEAPRTAPIDKPNEFANVVDEVPDYTLDATWRTSSLEFARQLLEGSEAPLDPELAPDIYRAFDDFEAGDYVMAAARLRATPGLGGNAGLILLMSLFYAGELESAEVYALELLDNVIAEETYPDAAGSSYQNAAAYYLARMHFDLGFDDSARRFARFALEKIDMWGFIAETLVAEQLTLADPDALVPASDLDEVSDAELHRLLLDWGDFIFPEDQEGRGFMWRTGVPPALEFFRAGNYAAAIDQLEATAGWRDDYLSGQFAPILLAVALIESRRYAEAVSLLEERHYLAVERGPSRGALPKFHGDLGLYYLARAYEAVGRIDDAREFAAVLADTDGVLGTASRQLMTELDVAESPGLDGPTPPPAEPDGAFENARLPCAGQRRGQPGSTASVSRSGRPAPSPCSGPMQAAAG